MKYISIRSLVTCANFQNTSTASFKQNSWEHLCGYEDESTFSDKTDSFGSQSTSETKWANLKMSCYFKDVIGFSVSRRITVQERKQMCFLWKRLWLEAAGSQWWTEICIATVVHNMSFLYVWGTIHPSSLFLIDCMFVHYCHTAAVS